MPRGKSLLELVRFHREEILLKAAHHGMKNVRLFGSVARGEEKEDSDVDFLVEVESGKSLFDLVGFGQDVEDILGCRADVVSQRGLSPYLKDRILNEAIYL